MNEEFKNELNFTRKARFIWNIILGLSIVTYIIMITYQVSNDNSQQSELFKMKKEISNNTLSIFGQIVKTETKNGETILTLPAERSLTDLIQQLLVLNLDDDENSVVINIMKNTNFIITFSYLLLITISLAMVRTYHNRIKSLLKYLELREKFEDVKDIYFKDQQNENSLNMLLLYFSSSISDSTPDTAYEKLFSKINITNRWREK